MKKKELDQKIFLDSMKQALRVEFISNSEELIYMQMLSILL